MSASALTPPTPLGARSGSSVEIRAVDRADAPGLAAFYRDLSPESLRRRFLGFCSGCPDALCQGLCAPDHQHEEGFVAVLRRPGLDDGRLVGHLCLVRDRNGRVELALAVADALQHQGIGRRLFTSALEWARTHDVQALVATCFVDNPAVLRLLTDAPGPPFVRAEGSGLVSVHIPISSSYRGPKSHA